MEDQIAPRPQGSPYTASSAFFESLWDAGVTHCFCNLGSDHPSILEAIVQGQEQRKGRFPKIITCPTEVGTPYELNGSHIGGTDKTY
jgi:hypothetical protein